MAWEALIFFFGFASNKVLCISLFPRPSCDKCWGVSSLGEIFGPKLFDVLIKVVEEMYSHCKIVQP